MNDDENRNVNWSLDECEKCPEIANFSQLQQQFLEGENNDNVKCSIYNERFY